MTLWRLPTLLLTVALLARMADADLPCPRHMRFVANTSAEALASGAMAYPNYLFRGPVPNDPDTNAFDRASLFGYLNRVAENDQQFTLPAKLQLIDISLLGLTGDDWTRVSAEMAYFNSTAKVPGDQFVYWPVEGSTSNATDIYRLAPRDYLITLATQFPNWSQDRVVQRVAQLHAWLETPSSDTGCGLTTSCVYYVHCYGGVDRTGELMGGYMLTYLNQSMEDVRTYSVEVKGCSIGDDNQMGFAWYCWYLYYVRGMTALNCPMPWTEPDSCTCEQCCNF